MSTIECRLEETWVLEDVEEMDDVVLSILEERAAFEERYPREQYEIDRAKAIAEGVDPRLIMSYSACIAWDMWQAEEEREREIWESYDEVMAERELDEEYFGPTERDEIIELAEMAWECSMDELAVFGNIEFENDERDIVGDELEGFWEFACDLADEPKPHGWVLDELY